MLLPSCQQPFYPLLVKRYALLSIVLTIGVASVYPGYLTSWIKGLGVGWLYISSLGLTTGLLSPAIQTGLSLFRMAVMAGILVWLGQGNITETIVVILGCLSYNLVLYWVGVEVSAGIRKSGHKPEA